MPPNSENSLESLFGKEGLRGLTQANAMTVQRNAAGGSVVDSPQDEGCPQNPFLPSRVGARGLT